MKRFMVVGYFLGAIVTVAWSADAQPLAICDTSTARCTSALLATESTFQYTADAGPTSLSGATDHVASDFGVNRIFASSLQAITGETEGTLDFFSTGQVISFILPAGASLQAASGTAYPTEVAAGPAELLQGLIAAVQALNLRRGIANSLDAKLSNAIQALDAIGAGATSSACGLLDAFAQEVRAQAGKALTDAQAAQLLAASMQIGILLGC